MIGAVMVLVTVLLLTPLFRYLPIAALGAVVLLAAVGLVDIGRYRSLRRIRTSDFVLSLVTLLGVLVFGVLEGIVIRVVVSLLETRRRAVLPHTAVLGEVAGSPTFRDIENFEDAATVPGLIVYRFDAPLFFANADVFKNDIRALVTNARDPVRQIIVKAEGITDMDVTGAEALDRVIADLPKSVFASRWRASAPPFVRRSERSASKRRSERITSSCVSPTPHWSSHRGSSRNRRPRPEISVTLVKSSRGEARLPREEHA